MLLDTPLKQARLNPAELRAIVKRFGKNFTKVENGAVYDIAF
jgi:hypothetical protein